MSTIDNMLSMLRKEGPVILLESQFGEHPVIWPTLSALGAYARRLLHWLDGVSYRCRLALVGFQAT